MTAPTDLAAALIRDVPRHGYANVDLRPDENGDWLNRDAVLAALSRALDPALAERAGEVAKELRLPWTMAENMQPLLPKAADLLTALLTANAALRAERETIRAAGITMSRAADKHFQSAKEEQARADAIEARLTAAEAEVEKLRAERDAAISKARKNAKIAAKAYTVITLASDDLEDEGDRVFLGSTNTADILRDARDEWAAHRIIGDSALTLVEQNRALKARAEAAEAEVEKLRGALDRIGKAWPIVRDADCSGGTLVWASDEIDDALTTEERHG